MRRRGKTGNREQSQNKAKGINLFTVSGIRLKRQKQSHGHHRALFQSFTAILTRFYRKLLPMMRLSLLPIRGGWDGEAGELDLMGSASCMVTDMLTPMAYFSLKGIREGAESGPPIQERRPAVRLPEPAKSPREANPGSFYGSRDVI